MKREEKQRRVNELHEKFLTSTVAILMEFSRLNVAETTELRRKLREAKGELCVVKNTLARRAVEGTRMAVTRDAFQGPIAVTLGYADPVRPTQILNEFVDKRAEKIKVKVGMVEGQILDSKGLKWVASLPTKKVLVAELISRIQSPINGLVGGLQRLLRKFLYVMVAIQNQRTTR